jgi:hypothetical protein
MEEITLQVQTPESGPEQAAELALLLRDQIKALPIESVQTPKSAAAPEGARGGEAFSWATLMVALAPEGVKLLLQLVQGVIARQRTPARVVLKYEGAELTIEGHPDPQQLQAASDFLDFINSKRAP